MSILRKKFKIFNGSSWDEYHLKTDSKQVIHTKADGTDTTVEEQLLALNSTLNTTANAATTAFNKTNMSGTKYFSGGGVTLNTSDGTLASGAWKDTKCKINIPAGNYLFTVTGRPWHNSGKYCIVTLGVSGLGSYESRNTFIATSGVPGMTFTHSFFAYADGGDYNLAVWVTGDVPLTLYDAEIAAIRLF